MNVLSIVFAPLVIACLCILACTLTYGAFFGPEDPRCEGDKLDYRS